MVAVEAFPIVNELCLLTLCMFYPEETFQVIPMPSSRSRLAARLGQGDVTAPSMQLPHPHASPGHIFLCLELLH